MERITIAHGAGGKITNKLIQDVFFKHFGNDVLKKAEDAATVEVSSGSIAFTTDSFVVKPIFFPGGDIGKLAVCGTVNDIAVSGARAEFLSCAFIIEEGLAISDLEIIVESMAKWAKEAGVKIVTGDTKVVGTGEADRIFINTSGVGVFQGKYRASARNIRPKDKVIISGTMGDHGIAVLSSRKGLEFETTLKSDCAPLNKMILEVLEAGAEVKFMRDPTRGGVATTLNEIVKGSGFGITLDENTLPVAEEVKGACELLGLDPLYVANEGKILFIVSPDSEEKALDCLRKNKYGVNAQVIGEVNEENIGKVCLKTRLGTTRIIDMPTAEQLPRIC